MDTQIAETAERLFAALVTKHVLKSAGEGVFPSALWDAVAGAGFSGALLPEAAGGFGITVQEALGLVRIAAAHTAPIPLAETMLAGWLLAKAGLAVPDGPLTVAPVRVKESLSLERAGDGWAVTGRLTRIPWARNAVGIAFIAQGPEGPAIGFLPGSLIEARRDANLAGEPRDTVEVSAILTRDAIAAAPPGCGLVELRAAGAAMRTVQIAGVMSRTLSLCVDFAKTRVQFGRAIGAFQAIQHNLARLAGEAAATSAAADMAADALAGDLAPLLVGAAKARAGEAASIAASIAHQSHGAIGFTREYELHHLTTRLWSWRDEFGNETEWNAVVGAIALAAGPDGLWPAMTAV